MIDTGKSCPGCGTTGKTMLLYEVAPGRRVCEECFDKVRAVEALEQQSSHCHSEPK